VPSQVIVQHGETLRSLAARAYGDSTLWYLIAEDNRLTDPDAVLEEGTQLRISREDLRDAGVDAGRS
jgi:nucleoid-associated protein YgaU